MYPPVFATLKNDTAVAALLGGNPFRVFVPGEAPQGSSPQTPQPTYLVWQIIGGQPENYVGDVPDTDTHTVQMDVYAAQLSDARAVAKAVRDAIEPVAYVTGWLGESREVDTRLYRVSFQVDWITNRSIN